MTGHRNIPLSDKYSFINGSPFIRGSSIALAIITSVTGNRLLKFCFKMEMASISTRSSVKRSIFCKLSRISE